MKDLITDFFKTLNIETADSFDEILDNVSDAFGEEAVVNIENIVYLRKMKIKRLKSATNGKFAPLAKSVP